MIRITKEQLVAMQPCDPEHRANLFGRHKYMTVALALKAGASISDILWVAGKLGLKAQCIEFALTCASHVASNEPTGAASRCIAATRAYIAEPSAENLKLMRSAAESSESAAESAWSAAESAAWSAWSAWSARSAAESSAAWSAWSARSAAESSAAESSAAESAAESARSAAESSAAWSAEEEFQKAALIKIFGGK